MRPIAPRAPSPSASQSLAWDEELAVHRRAVVPREQAAVWAAGVEGARAHWNRDFDGAQFSLGRAWYTHLETGRADAYFDDVAASDALVERACPGLRSTMHALAAEIVGAPTTQRPDWCGPGVHIFLPGSPVARNGGDVHFDVEGLTPVHASERRPAVTLVLMLQPPLDGGGLRVWDVPYAGSDDYDEDDLAGRSVTCTYEAGDLVVIDSYRLHQIQPFGGTRARISATCHLAFTAGQWESWF